MATFFTSDTHYFHEKLALIRGFKNAEQMNEALICDHNSVVKPGDTVYHLGDVSFGNAKQTAEVLNRLNGHIHLVPGNHDKRLLKDMEKTTEPLPLIILDKIVDVKQNIAKPDGTNDSQLLVLSHFPILSWNRAHYGSIHLHGHSHGSLRFPNPNARIMDVGVDTWRKLYFAPYSMAQVLKHMEGRGYQSFDQHKEVVHDLAHADF